MIYSEPFDKVEPDIVRFILQGWLNSKDLTDTDLIQALKGVYNSSTESDK